MRIKCSFTLEPEVNANHQYAIELLKRWQWVENKREDEPETSLNRRSRFHRDLYLSGLVLYQLAPTLPGLLPQLLLEGNLTQANLLRLLQASGFPYSPQNQGGLSDSQWDQLQKMLMNASLGMAKASGDGSGVSAQHLEFGFEQATKNIDMKLDKLIESQAQAAKSSNDDLDAKLTQLLDGQSALLEQLQNLPRQGGSSAQAKDVSNRLAQVMQDQERILQQIRGLKRDLQQGTIQVAAGAKAAVDDLDDVPLDLDDQLTKAAKVKSKKLW